MKFMEQIIYEHVLFASFVVMYIFGIFPFLTLIPNKEEYRSYNIARKVFGISMIIWASYIAFQWYFNFRSYDVLLASTMNLSSYYLNGMLLELAFSSLLNGYNPVSKRVKNIIIETIIFNAAIFTNYFFVPSSSQSVIVIVIAVAFVIRMTFLAIHFVKTYRTALKKGDNYYSDNVEVFVKWMPNSAFLVILLGFSGSVLSFASITAIAIYMFLGLVLFIYIFISFHNYMINIVRMKEVMQIDQLVPTNKSVNTLKFAAEERLNDTKMDKLITQWLATKGFVKKGLTIEELAVELDSNRTYISAYINSTYDLSFREWIAHKRIEYSKELLCETSNKELRLNEIANMVGYSSTAFNAVFVKLTKMTPSKWRSTNWQN